MLHGAPEEMMHSKLNQKQYMSFYYFLTTSKRNGQEWIQCFAS